MESQMPRLLLIGSAIVALLLSGPAAAQWAWRNSSGAMVFSDRAPPKSVPEKDILRRPEATAAPRYDAVPQAEAASDSKATAEVPKAAAAATAPAPKTLAEREIESRQRQQQLAEAQKKADDEEQRKAKMSENCERLRSYQRALGEGMRIARVNSAGERVVLDDAARAAESERTRAQIEQNCR
jgi:hypothetical protein